MAAWDARGICAALEQSAQGDQTWEHGKLQRLGSSGACQVSLLARVSMVFVDSLAVFPYRAQAFPNFLLDSVRFTRGSQAVEKVPACVLVRVNMPCAT